MQIIYQIIIIFLGFLEHYVYFCLFLRQFQAGLRLVKADLELLIPLPPSPKCWTLQTCATMHGVRVCQPYLLLCLRQGLVLFTIVRARLEGPRASEDSPLFASHLVRVLGFQMNAIVSGFLWVLGMEMRVLLVQ